MDINTIRGLSTVLVMIAFAAICWWAFSPRRKERFREAAKLPFADSPEELAAMERELGEREQQQHNLHREDEVRQEKL